MISPKSSKILPGFSLKFGIVFSLKLSYNLGDTEIITLDNSTNNLNEQVQSEVQNEPIDMILERQSHLSDLHTHLLGMGNTGFWIDSIIEKPYILPTHSDFCSKPHIRAQLCPLIWKAHENGGSFIDGKRSAKFIDLLIERGFPDGNVDDVPDLASENTDDALVFKKLINKAELIDRMKHYELSFGRAKEDQHTRKDDNPVAHKIEGDFTYDVVLTLSDLAKSLGIDAPLIIEFEDLVQSKVEEKLGLHVYPLPTGLASRPFRRWIVFNARKQEFRIVKGITVEILRQLIDVKANAPALACELARAHIQNAFSMCNPDGTIPRPIDFDKFHGSFTPEFYPRRFSLKDSLYSQRLDVLAALLVHVLKRYQACIPPIKYCELSIGIGDLCRPWVFDVLRSFPAYKPIFPEEDTGPPTSFSNLINKHHHFPHLRNAYMKLDNDSLACRPNVVYKFLAGFNRQNIVINGIENQLDALRLLNDSPNVAIHRMLAEIVQSEKDEKESPEIKDDDKVFIASTDSMLI
jgi:hypothetical protein